LLLPRIVSAVILAPLFLALVYLGFPWFNVLIAAITTIMAAEFARMDGERGVKRRFLISGACLAAVVAMSALSGVAAIAVIVLAGAAVIVADYLSGRRGFSLVHAAVPYAALPALALIYVRGSGGDRNGMISLYWLLAVVWGTDIGAYAFGRLIGGPKLAPAISPKKTWAGAIGGLLCGVGASIGVLAGFGLAIGRAAVLTALVAAVAAEVGDLLESALKRWYDVKDSGTLIPGHGGLMDRFDGLWAAAPVAALFCRLFGGGVDQW
jgi:phosphatidate cytidylyltransferase